MMAPNGCKLRPCQVQDKHEQSFLTRNLVALGYDGDRESKNRGPFRSTAGLTKAAGIRADDFVLDVGCGTGVVSREVARRLASLGMVIGFDFSWGAFSIAKSSVPSGHFVEMDAENIEMHEKFDRTVCQYALMFFTELAKALVQLRALLNEETGWLTVAAHRTPERALLWDRNRPSAAPHTGRQAH
jgi:SAM-dependent methyltransferase